jgi:predicted nucleic acid-binding protein
VSWFVDTSVWSLAFRRDAADSEPEVDALRRALEGGETVVSTGLVLQELLQGFHGPRARDRILETFEVLPFLMPDRSDHVRAAELRNACRRRGLAVGTIDVLLAALCVRHELTLLTTDRDFERIAALAPLRIWSRGAAP